MSSWPAHSCSRLATNTATSVRTQQVAHPCVDKSDTNNKEERIYHKYYQWVYFVLFFQACGFYAPHLVWKAWEAKLLRNLTVDLDLRSPLASDENEKRTAIRRIVRYFVRNEQSRNNRHQNYFRYFTLCEAMNFLNVIVQIYLVDEFLGGTFTTYGLDVLDYAQLDQEDRVDPMVRVFPRMTKCTFHRFGSSGDVQRHDALCILPLNIINEKIYIVMWFWFVFLALITGAWLVYRTFTIFKPSIRYKVLRRRASLANKTSMKDLVESVLDTGDWFLLSMMCKNMDSQWFKYLIENLAKQMTKSKRDKLMHNRLGKDRRPNYGRNNDETQSNIELQEADNLVPDDAGQSGSESDAGPADNLEEVAVKS